MQFPFKRKKSEIVRKAKEERIVYEAIYKFFGDDSIKDDMITIGRIYHDNDLWLLITRLRTLPRSKRISDLLERSTDDGNSGNWIRKGSSPKI